MTNANDEIYRPTESTLSMHCKKCGGPVDAERHHLVYTPMAPGEVFCSARCLSDWFHNLELLGSLMKILDDFQDRAEDDEDPARWLT